HLARRVGRRPGIGGEAPDELPQLVAAEVARRELRERPHAEPAKRGREPAPSDACQKPAEPVERRLEVGLARDAPEDVGVGVEAPQATGLVHAERRRLLDAPGELAPGAVAPAAREAVLALELERRDRRQEIR